MTADGSAGNNRDGFERWVASLQRPPGAATKSDPDLTSALVDANATRVQQIPKELIHRLRERETQGLLGVEVERTAIFKPPPELLARAKRMLPPSKPGSPSETPAAEQADLPTAPPPPPPEAAVPTVRPPPPAKAASLASLDDDWAEMVESGLDALKPIAPRASAASRPAAPVFSSTAPPRTTSTVPRPVTSTAPAPARAQASSAPTSSSAPASSDAPASSNARASQPGPAVVVGRTVAVVKNVEAGPAPTALPSPSSTPPRVFEDADALDEPTILRAGGFGGFGAAPAAAPEPAPAPATDWLDAEHPAPRVSGVVSHAEEAEERVDDSLAPEAIESGASGRRWVVIATIFLALVVLALAALKR